MHRFHIGRISGPNALPQQLIEGMYALRCQVFHEKLSWDVKVTNGLEYDEFDDADTVYVIGVNSYTGRVEASWRLRQSTTTYMLKDTFGQLLDRPAPNQPSIWEVSRFAVINTPYAESGAGSFSELTRDLVAHTVIHGVENGITNFVWLTSLGVERMARRLGYSLDRWGHPQRVGRVNCVVNSIRVDAKSIELAQQQLGFFHTLQVAA